MIITLKEVKKWLKIEQDFEDDDMLLDILIQGAEEYLYNATGKIFDDTNKIAKLYCLIWIIDRYENRGSEDLKVTTTNTLNSLSIQLQYCY